MSLSAPYDPNNIFARIIRGELPAIKVFEDDEALAFMDIFPQSEGHTLVIPKKIRATNFLDADPAALAILIARVQRVAKGVAKALNPDGIRVAQFNGAPAGQTVFHLHFHIIPIFDGAEVKRHAGEKADMAVLEALAEKIRAAI
ncbi:MAG: HIT family hydrolase [Alphaproteobacteria bacterium RIFCSPHIGHO2_12_FULL_63_12]|nr:MAG: HIT family hydrolase [Alphaproteobacteria bacterium RIFCSPHIGHO2_12_FULL_63_12]